VTGEGRRRVLILSADVGEGHDSAARTLAAELERDGAEVAVRDGLAALGRLLQAFVRDGSRIQFERYPWTFGPPYWLIMHVAPARWLAQRVMFWLGARGLLRVVQETRPDVIVSTYPGLTAVLGRLRRLGRIGVPACSAILDLTSFPFWAHRGVDHHFVMHEAALPQVERIAGAGGIRGVQPVVAPAFFEPRAREDARQALELPRAGRIVVVAGGGWGIGDIEGAVEVALSLEEATVVAVTGRNEELRRRLERRHADDPRVRVLGFTDRMSELLAAADVLVHPGGGVTTLEALARGCPTVIYAPPPGHWRANARAMGRLGLAEVVRDRRELRASLERESRPEAEDRRGEAEDGPSEAEVTPGEAEGRRREAGQRARSEALPSVASLVGALGPRVAPISRRRLAASRAAATLALTLFLGGVALSMDETYSLAARRFEKLRPLHELPVRDPLVGVVVRASARDAAPLARRLARQGVRVTFAAGSLDPRSIGAVRSVGHEVVPELRPSEPSRWVKTRGVLRREARTLGLPRRFFYLAPRDGATLGQYALARSAGGSPVAGSRSVGALDEPPPLRRGEIVIVTVSSGGEAARLGGELHGASGERLAPVPLGRLAAARTSDPASR
jgi:processive 1,2-diacylglycerol beta-glucosyltransferase